MLEQYMKSFTWATILGNGAPIQGLPKALIERSMLLVLISFPDPKRQPAIIVQKCG